ncbi:4-hydroxybenzoate octaprenyltransferase [Alphaproteobacteria bacterium]|nr:4-hydroxybenzoate octaprenyltransferase [Alphaproteobacteria bacterium]
MNDIKQDNLIFKIFPSFTHPYISLMRLDRPIGFLLLFYPISFSLVSQSNYDYELLKYFILFFIGSVVMRSAGCIINDILDKNIDEKVERTQSRPLASSKLSILKASITLVILLLIGLLILINLNKPSIVLGLIIIPLVVLYPLAKKFFALPQLILAMTYNWGCMIGWVTISSPYNFNNIFILYLSLIIWTIVYDTIYALQDEVEDRKMNLYSSAILFGSKKLLILNALIITQYFLLIVFGYQMDYGVIFYVIVVFISLLNLGDIKFLWKNEARKSGLYFKRNNYYGFLILLSIMIGSQFNV